MFSPGIFWSGLAVKRSSQGLRPGDVVIMVNLPAHKVAGVRQAIETAAGKPQIPSALQPRLQSHRNGLRKGQIPAPSRSRANHSRPLAGHRRRLAALHASRMHKLSRRRRIRCNMNGKRSKYRPDIRPGHLGDRPHDEPTPRKCLGFKTPFQALIAELGKDVQIRFSSSALCLAPESPPCAKVVGNIENGR